MAVITKWSLGADFDSDFQHGIKKIRIIPGSKGEDVQDKVTNKIYNI